MSIEEHFKRIEILLILLNPLKEWFRTDEVAAFFEVTVQTARDWCKQGEIQAVKCGARCGAAQEWRVSRTEMLRYQREGKYRQANILTAAPAEIEVRP